MTINTDAFPLLTMRSRVPYYELMQGLQQVSTQTEQRVTRVCRVAFANLGRWGLDMLGDAVPARWGASAAISRITPDNYIGNIYAQGIEFRMGLDPFQSDLTRGGLLLFREYVYAVHYAMLSYDVLADDSFQMREGRRLGQTVELLRYVTRTATQAVEAIAVPGGPYKYVGTTVPLNEPPPKALPTRELTYTWHQVPAERVPVAAITGCSGRVNSTAFDAEARAARWPFRNFAAGTLLLTGADFNSYLNVVGRPCMDITYKMAERNNGDAAEGGGVKAGWNHVYRPTTGEWLKVTHDGTAAGRTIYQTADFNGLFTPA